MFVRLETFLGAEGILPIRGSGPTEIRLDEIVAMMRWDEIVVETLSRKNELH